MAFEYNGDKNLNPNLKPEDFSKPETSSEWDELDEVIKKNVAEFHEQHQEYQQEIQELEAELNIITKFFNKRLRTARKKLMSVKNKLNHPRYVKAAELHKNRQTSQEAPLPSSEVQEKKRPYQAYSQDDLKRNYSRLHREKKEAKDKLYEQRAEDQIMALEEEMNARNIEPEVEISSSQESIIDLAGKLTALKLTKAIESNLEQLTELTQSQKINEAMEIAAKVREEIINSGAKEDVYIEGIKIYNELRTALKEWAEDSEPEAEDEEKELEVVNVKESYEHEEGQPIISIESKGKALESRGKISEVVEYQGYKIQMHGEDASIYNEATGTGVVIDGISSGQRETTLKMAKQAAVDLMKILESNPGDFNIEKMLANLNIEGFGGVMIMGFRYLPKMDSIFLVDIGNCQAYLGQENIKINEATKEGRREPVKVVKNRMGVLKLNDKRSSEQQVYTRIIKLEDYRKNPEETLTLLMGSDGYEESTGKPLLESLDKNINELVAKDDITILKIEIPGLTSKTKEAVAA